MNRHLLIGTCAAAALCFGAREASANINLELRPGFQSVNAGETVQVGLYAVSDNGAGQTLVSLSVVLGWDPAALTLVGTDFDGSDLLPSNFLLDPFGLNEATPPCDGDGLWAGFTLPPNTVTATPAGTLLVSFEFEAVSGFGTVEILPQGGDKKLTVETKVLSDDPPGSDVTGVLGGPVTVQVNGGAAGTPCLGDVNADGMVDILDVLGLLAAWGPCDSPCTCASDVIGPGDTPPDGLVDVSDLIAVLVSWGPCP